MGARFFARVRTGPGAHPASYTMSTGHISRGQSGRNVALTTHHYLVSRPSWPVLGRTLTLPHLVRRPDPIPCKRTTQLGSIRNQDVHSSNFDQETDYISGMFPWLFSVSPVKYSTVCKLCLYRELLHPFYFTVHYQSFNQLYIGLVVCATGSVIKQNTNKYKACVISGFRRGVNEICALLGFYAA